MRTLIILLLAMLSSCGRYLDCGTETFARVKTKQDLLAIKAPSAVIGSHYYYSVESNGQYCGYYDFEVIGDGDPIVSRAFVEAGIVQKVYR